MSFQEIPVPPRSAVDCCEEPFRLFFPVGAFLGFLGVALWPLYYADLFAEYPSILHARLMVEGFMTSFIIGFLGTAGPRITSARHFSRVELLLLFTLDLLVAGFHFGGAHRMGDLLFALFLCVFAVVLGKRFVQRADSPPPNFVLVGLGVLNGMVGALLLALFGHELYSLPYRIGTKLLEQGFVLFPILGVGPFLLARLLDLPPPGDLPESRALPAGWWPRAGFALLIGLTIDATFVVEAFAGFGFGAWLRPIAILLYLLVRLPRRGSSFLGNCLRAGAVALVIGMSLEALWPQQRIAALHIVFITGFSFIILTVAIRVIFGHSGNAHLFSKRLPFFIAVSVLLFLAMLARYEADLTLTSRPAHLVAAALCWLGGLAIWMVKVLPKVAVAEVED